MWRLGWYTAGLQTSCCTILATSEMKADGNCSLLAIGKHEKTVCSKATHHPVNVTPPHTHTHTIISPQNTENWTKIELFYRLIIVLVFECIMKTSLQVILLNMKLIPTSGS